MCTTWLHNMSVPSNTTIVHVGVQGYGQAVRYEMPMFVGESYRTLLTWIDLNDGNPAGVYEDPEAELRKRINAHGQTMPHIAWVSNVQVLDATKCDDPLAIVTVITKSSGLVFLRDKEPNMSALWPRQWVTLIFPERRGGKT